MSNFESRFRAFVEKVAPGRGRYGLLEGWSNIAAYKWKAVMLGKQKPAIEMVERLCQLFPEFGFWLITGIDDSAYGHQAPSGCGYPKASQKKAIAGEYLSLEIEHSKEADAFVLKNYTDDELKAENELEKQSILDDCKRYIRDDGYFNPSNNRKLLIKTDVSENQAENERIRFMEVLVENLSLLKNKDLELALATHIVSEIASSKKGHKSKFEVLEKANELKVSLEKTVKMLVAIRKLPEIERNNILFETGLK